MTASKNLFLAIFAGFAGMISSLLPTHRSRFSGVLVVAALALALAGCAKNNPKISSHGGGPAVSELTSQEELAAAIQYWSKQYSKDRQGKVAALNYSAALRIAGQTNQAVAILQRTAIYHSTDREVLAALGKALAADGNLQMALVTINRAQTPDQPDWKLVSAEGAILDQLERHDEARAKYTIALNLSPNEPTILSNMGMSLMLSGDLKQSESYFKRAVSSGSRDIRIRQNYALAVGLQGRIKEAQQIAVEGMSSAAAQQNIAYLQQVLGNQGGRWDQIRAEG
jgi:Flp pilus assembly protein TadD